MCWICRRAEGEGRYADLCRDCYKREALIIRRIWGGRPSPRVYRRDPRDVHPVDLLNGLRGER